MNTATVRFAFRPVRIGWIVDPRENSHLHRAMQLSHMLWGGRFNPMIPLDDPELADALVKLFAVDLLYPVDKSETGQAMVSKYSYLSWPLGGGPELLSEENEGPFFVKMLDVSHAMFDLKASDREAALRLQFDSAQFDWEPDDPLSGVFNATFGAYDNAVHGKRYSDLYASLISPERIVLDKASAVPEKIVGLRSPSSVSARALRPEIAGHEHHAGFFIGDARSGFDLISYWNLRAAGMPVIFFDPQHGDRLEAFVTSAAESLEKALSMGPEWERTIALWVSRDSAPLPDFLKDRKPLVRRVSKNIWNGLSITAPSMRFEQQTALATVIDADGSQQLTFEAEDARFTKAPGAQFQSVILSVSTPIVFTRAEESTFSVPFIPEMNEHLSYAMTYRTEEIRAERRGFGVIVDASKSHVRLKALQIHDLVVEIFKTFGIRAVPSKPGLIARRLIKQMGGVQGCRVFKIQGVRDLINAYTASQTFGTGPALSLIGKGFSRYATEHFVPRETKSKQTARDALRYLLDRGVLRVGADLECPNCGLVFWLSLDELKTEVECQFCGHRFNTTAQIRDRDFWRYRRSGLFGIDDHQQGSVPVSITIQQLVTTGAGSFRDSMFTTALSLFPAGADIPSPSCETDFIFLTQELNGKVQLALGEAKGGKEISLTDIANMAKVAAAFPSHRFDTYVVFSKTSDFSEAEIKRFRDSGLLEWPHRMILLSGREFDHYDHMRELRSREVRFVGRGLRELATASHYTYGLPTSQALTSSPRAS